MAHKNGRTNPAKSNIVKRTHETIFRIAADHTTLSDSDLAHIIIDIHKMFGSQAEQLRQAEDVSQAEIDKLRNHSGIFLPDSDQFITYNLKSLQIIRLYNNGAVVDGI